jgi:hypothetical protein
VWIVAFGPDGSGRTPRCLQLVRGVLIAAAASSRLGDFLAHSAALSGVMSHGWTPSRLASIRIAWRAVQNL